MAICNTCGKKYSKFTTPVSAKGVCRECFEVELGDERKVERQQEDITPPSIAPEKPAETWLAASPLTLGVLCGTVVVGILLLLLIAGFIYAIVRSPTLARLRDADQLVALFANLAVVFFAFPAYTQTKNKAFLALGFAALSFAYGVLFTLVLSGAPVTRWSRFSPSEVRWYYASQRITDILGMLLYAYGIARLARSAVASGKPPA